MCVSYSSHCFDTNNYTFGVLPLFCPGALVNLTSSIAKSHSSQLMSSSMLAELVMSPLAVSSSLCGDEYRQERGWAVSMQDLCLSLWWCHFACVPLGNPFLQNLFFHLFAAGCSIQLMLYLFFLIYKKIWSFRSNHAMISLVEMVRQVNESSLNTILLVLYPLALTCRFFKTDWCKPQPWRKGCSYLEPLFSSTLAAHNSMEITSHWNLEGCPTCWSSMVPSGLHLLQIVR